MGRVRGRKPTFAERKTLANNNFNTYDWLITKSTVTFIEVVNKNTGECKQIIK